MDHSNCKITCSSVYTNEVNRYTIQLLSHPTSPAQLVTFHLSSIFFSNFYSIISCLVSANVPQSSKRFNDYFLYRWSSEPELKSAKGKIFLSTTWRNIGELEVNLHSVLTSAFHGRFTPRKEHRYFWREQKYLSPTQTRTQNGPAPSLVAIPTTPVQLPTW
jgi:hypothetical protein